jgi:DNA-binding beta-propeller fold protein YncE
MAARRRVVSGIPHEAQEARMSVTGVRIAVAALAALLVAPAGRSAGDAVSWGTHVMVRWQVGGEGGWDALTADPRGRRLYLSHGTGVDVLDLDHGTRVARIEPTPGVHAIAIAPDLGRGFISCGRDSSVVVFDLKTAKTLQRVAIPGRNPDAIEYEPVTHRVLAFNGGSANAVALDGSSGEIVGTVPLGGRPEFAVADGHGAVFVNIEDKSELVRIDPRTLTVVSRWPLAPGEEPSGLAIDVAGHRLFAACGNQKMVVVDSDSGRVIASLPIGRGVDGAAFDPVRRLAYTSNGEGTLTVVREASPDSFVVAATDSTERGARTIALDERTGRVFTPTAAFGPPPADSTAANPRRRPPILPGTFHVIVTHP